MEIIGLGQLDDESSKPAKAEGSTLQDVAGVDPTLIVNTADVPAAGQDLTPERIQALVEQTAYSLYEERHRAGVNGSSEQDWEDAKQQVRNLYGVEIA
jgi:hypothetical protein